MTQMLGLTLSAGLKNKYLTEIDEKDGRVFYSLEGSIITQVDYGRHTTPNPRKSLLQLWGLVGRIQDHEHPIEPMQVVYLTDLRNRENLVMQIAGTMTENPTMDRM